MSWDPCFLARSPMFEPLRMRAPAFGPDWPDRAGLQRALDACNPPVANEQGMPLELVPPARRTGAPGDRYEARVFRRGELEVRERNWHDLFNVLVWLAFPRVKAALNGRHHAALESQLTANRGPAQDALTLFDEGGVIVAAADDELLELLRGFHWKDLFWRRREAVRLRMRFLVVGHALHEKALAPFTGITARGILMRVQPSLLAAEPARLVDALDARAASWIGNPATLSATRDLAPVPVLGVPGWCADNEREDYYDNEDYFRSGRRE
jgi:hypothetical protein